MGINFCWSSMLASMSKINQKVLILLLAIALVQAIWVEFELIKPLNSKTGQFQTDFYLKRIKKVQSVEGKFVFFEDYDDNFDCEAKMYYSAIGNSQFKALPYKLAKDNCCIIFDTSFWKALHSELERASELDIDRNKPSCYSYKKGNYTLRGFIFNKSALPKQLQPGSYKMRILFYRQYSDTVDSNFGFMFRLY